MDGWIIRCRVATWTFYNLGLNESQTQHAIKEMSKAKLGEKLVMDGLWVNYGWMDRLWLDGLWKDYGWMSPGLWLQ